MGLVPMDPPGGRGKPHPNPRKNIGVPHLPVEPERLGPEPGWDWLNIIGILIIMVVVSCAGYVIYREVALKECHTEKVLEIGSCNDDGWCRVETEKHYLVIQYPMVGQPTQVCKYREETREWLRWLN